MSRSVPVLQNRLARTVLGAALLGVAGLVVLSSVAMGRLELLKLVILLGVPWAVSVSLTDKYTHKYPYRYYSYLTASHGKALVVFALVLWAGTFLFDRTSPVIGVTWKVLGLFTLLDFLASLPNRPAPLQVAFDPSVLRSREMSAQSDGTPGDNGSRGDGPRAPGPGRTFSEVAEELGPELARFIGASMKGPAETQVTTVIDDRAGAHSGAWDGPLSDVIVCRVRMNDIRRINRFLLWCAPGLRMGGVFVVSYEPLEDVRESLEARWGGFFQPAFLAHFGFYRVFPKIPGLNKLYFGLTRGWGRNLSKAEVWGRLSFCGLRVAAEERVGGDRWVAAHKVAPPITNKRPSYYPIVGLSKVGLDGQMLLTHKVRSMYPFSEFLQKQIFEDHGLAKTGKFKDDFRLTEYGRHIRRYWVDELPQIYDWLRGDIKLVGIRATSPHFLGLYSDDFIAHYVKVKPGLIPPLFDEDTDGFDHIVEIELEYLGKYVEAPNRTDLEYFWQTFSDIVFRGVRSK